MMKNDSKRATVNAELRALYGETITRAQLYEYKDRTGYLPGLSCAHHNRAEGASRGNAMRGVVMAWRTARRW